MPVEALLLPLRMPLFCSFEIIALVGCGIRRDPLFAYFADEWICILQLNRFIARSMPSEIRTLAASPARSRASIRAL